MPSHSGENTKKKVIEVLEEFERVVSYIEIKKRIKEKHPNKTIYKYIYNILPDMEKDGEVTRIKINGKIYWKLK